MPDLPTPDQQREAVRTFAHLTEKTARLIGCSYEEAAVFLVKLGPFVTMMQDKDFIGKLNAYSAAVTATQTTGPERPQ